MQINRNGGMKEGREERGKARTKYGRIKGRERETGRKERERGKMYDEERE